MNTPGGAPVATLNLATTEMWNDKAGQRQEKTEWHRVVLWGKTAESLNEYLVKGKQIYVEGRLQTRQWDDKDGNKRYTTEIRGDRVVLKSRDGEVMAKVLARQSPKNIELLSLNPEHPNRSFDMADVEWIARIIWASQ